MVWAPEGKRTLWRTLGEPSGWATLPSFFSDWARIPKLRISLNSNSSRGIIGDITRYGRFSGKNDFFDYMALGRVWYGAKYSHKMWEQFAHTFEKSDLWLKVYILIHDLYATIVCWNLCFPMFETKCYRQNDCTDHGIISWFSEKVTLQWYLPVRSLFFMGGLLSRFSV